MQFIPKINKHVSLNKIIRTVIVCVLLTLLLLYIAHVKIEEYFITHVSHVTILSCGDEVLSEPVTLPVSPVSADFEMDEENHYIPITVKTKRLSPLPSHHQNTTFRTYLSKNPGQIKIVMPFIFLHNSKHILEFEINSLSLWNKLKEKSKEKWHAPYL